MTTDEELLAELDRLTERLEIQATTLRVIGEQMAELAKKLADAEEDLSA